MNIEPQLHTKSLFLIGISSFLTISLLGTSINFVSASSYECFGSSLDQYICVGKNDVDGSIFVFECVVSHNPYNVDCHNVQKTDVPSGIKADIDASIQEVGPSSPNDSKNLGGIKTDKGTTMSPSK